MPHGDFTGNQKALLAQKFQEQQALAATQMSLVNQIVAENSDTPVNLMEHFSVNKPTELVAVEGEDGAIEVDSEDPTGLWSPRKFRASDTVDGVTIGKDTEFNLKEGQIYIVPTWVYVHMDEKGLVWH